MTDDPAFMNWTLVAVCLLELRKLIQMRSWIWPWLPVPQQGQCAGRRQIICMKAYTFVFSDGRLSLWRRTLFRQWKLPKDSFLSTFYTGFDRTCSPRQISEFHNAFPHCKLDRGAIGSVKPWIAIVPVIRHHDFLSFAETQKSVEFSPKIVGLSRTELEAAEVYWT